MCEAQCRSATEQKNVTQGAAGQCTLASAAHETTTGVALLHLQVDVALVGNQPHKALLLVLLHALIAQRINLCL